MVAVASMSALEAPTEALVLSTVDDELASASASESPQVDRNGHLERASESPSEATDDRGEQLVRAMESSSEERALETVDRGEKLARASEALSEAHFPAAVDHGE